MRFFADHCVPESVAKALETEGHEVIRLRHQLLNDTPDSEVIAEAQDLNALLLSLNVDFSDLVRYPPQQYGGIVSLQVRGRPEVLDPLIKRLTDYLEANPKREHYRGKLLLVEAHRIRVRSGRDAT
ncbi:MAG: hypothetical protein BRD28_03555 [Bacteroidetes bacterium QH_10_64_37]|nr:MAG: hypothetical protein BRD28_03555 [Bacteroidetes bacterium QH_10_64_37]